MRVLWGLIASVALLATSAEAQVSNPQVGALVEALRLAAPQTNTEDDGLYSEWQVKPDNIPRWSKQCVGRELTTTQFENSPVTARGILVCVMRNIFDEQYLASGKNEAEAVQRAAAWWMTGDANRYNSDTIAPYIQKVLQSYQQLRSNPSASISADPQPKPVTQPKPKPTAANPSAESTQISNGQVGVLVEALRQAAPQTGITDDGLYSDWQVKADNIPRWSEQCLKRSLTPTQFEASPVTARSILVCVVGNVLKDEYRASNNEAEAVQRAAAWWMTGDSSRYKSAPTDSYTQKVLGIYQQLRLNPQTAEPTLFPHRSRLNSHFQAENNATAIAHESTQNSPDNQFLRHRYIG